MLEFAIIVPLYVLLVGGVVDMGRALERYFLLRRVAYEGGRIASNTEGLEVGTFNPNEPDSDRNMTVHGTLHGKIRNMIDFQGDRLGDSVTIITERENDGSNLVGVSLQASLQPIALRFFPSIPISARVEAPYLFVE